MTKERRSVERADRHFYFPGKREDECVEFIIRQHWVFTVTTFMFMGCAYALLALLYSALTFKIIPLEYSLASILLLVTVVTLVGFVVLTQRYLTVVLITSQRVIYSHCRNIFDHQNIELNLNQIQDVLGARRGLMGMVFRVGSITIQTAGRQSVTASAIKRPHMTARAILNVQKYYVSERKNTITT